MSEDAKKKIKLSKKTLITTILVILGLAAIGGIVYYAWSQTGADQGSDTTTNNSSTNSNNTTTSASVTEERGAYEISLTPENYDATIATSGVVIVDVYLPTCSHCQKVAPILTEISNEYVGQVTVAKMNASVTENVTFITEKFSDFAYVPAFWVYKDGELVDSYTGEKTKEELIATFSDYLE